MRQRHAVVGAALLLLAGGIVGAVYALHSPPRWNSGPPAGSTHVYRSSLGWSLRFPRAMHVEHSAGSGFSFAVDETTFSSFRSKHGVQVRTSPGSKTIREVPPRNRSGAFPPNAIAVRVLFFQTLGGPRPGTTQLPLRLSQFREVPQDWYAGTEPRPLQHSLLAKGRNYVVQVWVGQGASNHQRAVIDRMLASLSVRRIPRNRG